MIIGGIVTLVLAVVGLLVTLVGARRLGLTTVQQAADKEQEKVMALMKDRIDLLEQRANDQDAKIVRLTQDAVAKDEKIAAQRVTIEAQARELQELHEVIADGALEALKEIVREARSKSPQRGVHTGRGG